MRKRTLSLLTAVLFNLVSISLIAAILFYRSDFISAQGNTEDTDTAAVLPRSTQVASDDEEDDDDGDADPPTDNDGYDTPPGETDNVIVYTIRPGDTLLRIAARLGVPLAVLKSQDDTPSMIHPGQVFTYRPSDRIDSSIPLTDDDGTDSDGYDTPPPSTDFDGISTPPPTDNDGMDSDGYDTTGNWTDNDGTDSDGYDTTGNWTDNDGTDSDGYDTTGNEDTDDSDDSDDSGVSS